MRCLPAVALVVCLLVAVARCDDADAPVELTDDTFDAAVFPTGVPFDKQPAYLIFFYAPWCGHCKKMKPIFRNASDTLKTSQFAGAHAKFALVDAVKNKELAKRFNVKSFPTFFYTVNGRGHHYEGSRGALDLLSIAVYAHHGVQLGSFADDVSSPERFELVDKEAPGRAAFIVFVPKETTRKREARTLAAVDPLLYTTLDAEDVEKLERKERDLALPNLFHIAVESLISYGKSRFGVIYEDKIPSAVSGNHEQFSQVMEMAHKCQRSPLTRGGPNGETLVLYSDAHRKPLCFPGPWLKAGSKISGAVAPDMPRGVGKLEVRKELFEWVDRSSILAVEEISSETYATMSRRPGLLMVLASNGPLKKDDTTMLPILREIVQERNAAMLASEESMKSNIELVDDEGQSARPTTEFIFAHLDGNVFHEWCKEHGLSVPGDFPALLAVAPAKELAYHAKHVDGWLDVKDKQWSIGGPQHEKIKTFMRKLDRGEIPAFRVSTVGKIAEVLLAVPFADKLHDVLGSDDTTFLMVVFIVLFTIFVIALACRPDNSDPSEQQQQRERQTGVRRRREKTEKEE
jgi:thiol-disulfide isomerase/thioredoxin